MPNSANLVQPIGEQIREQFIAKNSAREVALAQSRQLVRFCAETIRATHRSEFTQARLRLEDADKTAIPLRNLAKQHPDLYYTGYVQDALKEWVEANLVLAFITDSPLPSTAELQVEAATYIHGMAEAASELRRAILDLLRHDQPAAAERLLELMDDIYLVLVALDFPDALTNGLRRQTDVLRAVLERTRSDLTLSLRQARLEQILRQTSLLS